MFLDGDRLPGWYETDVLGTDPLDYDSDSLLTTEDEGGNNITDDMEDFDMDSVPNYVELFLGSDPFLNDTDEDGLLDYFEFWESSTNLTSSDTDGNGTLDPDEDFDNDTITNIEEQEHNTNPWNNDTDHDGLPDDYEIYTVGTDPTNPDTDDDSLEDGSELRFGTDPFNQDSDGDEIHDGNEIYPQIFINETAGADITIDGIGDLYGKVRIREIEDPFAAFGEVPGDINRTVDIDVRANFTSAMVKVYYNESDLNGENESRLRMLYWNETSYQLEFIEEIGVNTSENYVWANVTHFSILIPADISKWIDSWTEYYSSSNNIPHIPH